MGDHDKILILVSQSLLRAGVLPKDLLAAGRFDIRTLDHPLEISSLSKVLSPRLLIMDLKGSPCAEGEIKALIEELRQIARERYFPAFPVLGVLDESQAEIKDRLYQEGINALINRPIDVESLREEIETLLGLKFRRYERKEINLPLTLTKDDSTWQVMGRIINAECLVIDGKNLPPLGINVWVESLNPSILDLKGQVFCWRTATPPEKGHLLRFLEPSDSLLQAIDALPTRPDLDSLSVSSTADAGGLPNPRKLSVVDLPLMTQNFGSWLSGASKPPAAWHPFIQGLAPQISHFILGCIQTQPVIGESFIFHLLLKAQLETHTAHQANKALGKEAIQRIVAEHEKTVKSCEKTLSTLIGVELENKNDKQVTELNELKSALQKVFMLLKQTLADKNLYDETTAEASTLVQPKKRPPGAKAARSQPSARPSQKVSGRFSFGQIVTVGLLLLLAGGSIAFAYWQLTGVTRARSELNIAELQALSPYFSSAERYHDEKKNQLTIHLNGKWDELSEEMKVQEKSKIEQKLKSLQITDATLQAASGHPVGVYHDAQLRLLTAKKP